MPYLLVLIDITIICHCSVHRCWNRPDFALADHVCQRMSSCYLLLEVYECGNTNAAAVYDLSLTTVYIKPLLKYITAIIYYKAYNYNNH